MRKVKREKSTIYSKNLINYNRIDGIKNKILVISDPCISDIVRVRRTAISDFSLSLVLNLTIQGYGPSKVCFTFFFIDFYSNFDFEKAKMRTRWHQTFAPAKSYYMYV